MINNNIIAAKTVENKHTKIAKHFVHVSEMLLGYQAVRWSDGPPIYPSILSGCSYREQN